MRQCGECQLCCKLLPVPPLAKKANEKCQFQKFGKGCTIYHTAMPTDCQVWNCRWLLNNDTADLPRPDRSHYVIDVMPDRIQLRNDETGEIIDLIVVQIWIDPNHREVIRDKHLRDYMLRRAMEGEATLIRFDPRKSVTVFPPPLSHDGEWHEVPGTATPGFKGLFR